MTCLQCGSEVKNAGIKFCSRKCSATYNNKLRVSRSPDCLECGISMRGHTDNRKYCSKKCEFLYKKKLTFSKIESGNHGFSERTVKLYLIETNGEKCSTCGWKEVNKTTGKVPIELDHINGNCYDNNLDNVRLLCPNCHSLTPTFRALNLGSGREKRRNNKILRVGPAATAPVL